MKIQQSRRAWGGESHKELESLLHSIPRQELEMEALEESEFDLLEWRVWACSTGKYNGREWRAIESGGIYIELSKETSRWAQIQNSDIVRGSWTMSGRIGQCPIGYFCGAFLNSRAISGRTGQCSVETCCFRWIEKDLEFAWIDNSTEFLY
jgi:hypothetical protein